MIPMVASGPRRRDLLLAALALVGGCGGVDSGGTGSAPSYSVGPISGLGSVTVNGVRYDDGNATIADDDEQAFARSALALGMQVEVAGSEVTAVGGVATAAASSIRVVSTIVGPVEANDPAASFVVVLGQRVLIGAGTVFGEGLVHGRASLVVGDLAEVHAVFDAAADRYFATRIDIVASASRYKLRGVVSELRAAERRVVVGGLVIDWSGLSLDEPGRTLAPGQFVRVVLETAPAGGAWRALSIRSAAPSLEDRERFEIEGRITAFVSIASFAVNGVPVDAAAARFPEGSGGIALGTRVEVEGQLRNGLLVARSVKVEGDDDDEPLELKGRIESVDSALQRFVVRGVSVAWDASTRFDSGTAADLVVGREVKVKGALSADGTFVLAAEIHVER